jgi:hypothetical protein
VASLDDIPLYPGSYYVMDRGHAACGMTATMPDGGICRIAALVSSDGDVRNAA